MNLASRLAPVVRHLAGAFTLMGPAGAGQTTKMVNQVIVGGCKSVIAEAIQLAMNSGIDATRLPEAFAGGRADSSLLRQSVPKMVSSWNSDSVSILLPFFFIASKKLNIAAENISSWGAARK